MYNNTSCYLILNEGEEEDNKKIDIEPHLVERLNSVIMARMLQGDASTRYV